MKDAIAGSDMGQEGVPQALAGVGTLHQACNVHHIKECWNFAANQEDKTKQDLRIETTHPRLVFFSKFVYSKNVLMFIL